MPLKSKRKHFRGEKGKRCLLFPSWNDNFSLLL